MFQTAELLRTPLHELCLQAKLLSTPSKKRRSRTEGTSAVEEPKPPDTISDFLCMAPEPPSKMMLDNAVDLLKTIDALDETEDLTELGQHLVDLPIEPRLGKMVLYSVVLKCLDPVLTIACALAYKDPFLLPQAPEEKRQARNCRNKFAAGAFSDHMCLLRAFQAWQKAKSDGWERAFCDKNFLSPATMQMIIGMRTQLLGQLRAAGFVRARGGSDIRDLNTNSENWAVVKAALCASAFPNVLRFDRNNLQLRCRLNKKVRFNNSSVLSQPLCGRGSHAEALMALPTTWVVYDELTTIAGHFSSLATARCCTVVTPACVSLFAGPSFHSQNEAVIEPDYDSQVSPLDSDSETEDKQMSRYATLLITDWIRLRMDPQVAEMILHLRVKWYSLFLRRIRAPAKPWSPEDEAVLNTIINILSSEDQAHNLLQPSGIGQRPRPMSQEDSRSQKGFTGVHMRTPGKKGAETPPPIRTVTTPSQNGMHQKSSGRLSTSLPLEDTSGCTSPCPSPQIGADYPCDAISPKPNPSAQIRYIAIVLTSQKNIQISQRNGVLLTNATEEKILSEAFQDSAKVLLVVFLRDTRFAEGFARVSSPGTQFTNALESQNLGWEVDGSQSENSPTAYFYVEWIVKVTRLVEVPPKRPENDTVWELEETEGEKLLTEWGVAPVPQPISPFQAANCHPITTGALPSFFSNLHPSYSFPGMHPGLFNPYLTHNPSPMQPMFQRMQPPFCTPYTHPHPYQDPARFPQLGGLPPSTSHQSHSYSYLRQNKGSF